MSVIKAGTTLTTAYTVEADTTGALEFKTGPSATLAMSISASGVVTFPATTGFDIASANITNLTSTTLTVSKIGIFPAGSATVAAITTVGDTNNGIFFPAADVTAITTAGTERLRVDASGNLGLGVTPSAWGNNYKALESAGNAAAVVAGANVNGVIVSANAYQDNTNWIYKTTGTAAYYAAGAGTGIHAWYTAPSGTAGGTISFTQAMTLTADVQLGIGTTSPSYPLQVRRAGGACSLGLTMDNYGAIAELARSVFYYAIGDSTTDKTGHLFFTRDATATDNLRMVINSSGNVGIGTSSPSSRLTVSGSVQVDAGRIGYLPDGDTFSYNSGTYANYGLTINTTLIGLSGYYGLAFFTSAAERARITSGGDFAVGTTTPGTITGGTFSGASIGAAGWGMFQRDADIPFYVNRNTDDGDLVRFYQAATLEGTISVSGTTVSYNGGHLSRWSQTTDNTRIPLLKGTVMSNLDQMAVWEKDGQPLPNEQLNCMKVSDVEGDVNVAGVFVNWDNDDDEFANDMNVAMTGDMIIRIAQGVVVQRGDLLMSAGDGTAKPQGDDIIRSKTVAKVTSNHVTCTYEDGSYCVPCVLMAC